MGVWNKFGKRIHATISLTLIIALLVTTVLVTAAVPDLTEYDIFKDVRVEGMLDRGYLYYDIDNIANQKIDLAKFSSRYVVDNPKNPVIKEEFHIGVNKTIPVTTEICNSVPTDPKNGSKNNDVSTCVKTTEYIVSDVYEWEPVKEIPDKFNGVVRKTVFYDRFSTETDSVNVDVFLYFNVTDKGEEKKLGREDWIYVNASYDNSMLIKGNSSQGGAEVQPIYINGTGKVNLDGVYPYTIIANFSRSSTDATIGYIYYNNNSGANPYVIVDAENGQQIPWIMERPTIDGEYMSWEADKVFDNASYFNFVDDTATISDIGNLGSITLTKAGTPDMIEGHVGRAMRFGEASSEAYTTTDKCLNASGGFTVGGWIKSDGRISTDFIFSCQGRGGANDEALSILITSGDLWRVQYRQADTTQVGVNGFTADLNWHHVMATYEGGTNGLLHFYVDGIEQGNVTVSGSGDNLQSGMAFGKVEHAGTHYFNGSIDNFVIYEEVKSSDWVLSQAQVNRTRFESTNTAPSISLVQINTTNTFNYTNGTIQLQFNISDADNGNVNTTVTWMKDGTIQSALDSTITAIGSSQVTVNSGNTTRGENWTATVSAFDGTARTNSSTSVIIVNYIPTFNVFLFNSTDRGNHTNGTLQAYIESYDLDGDTVNQQINWLKDGVIQTALANLTSVASGNTTSGEVWNVSLYLTDPVSTSSNESATLTIANAAPDFTALGVSPASASYDTNPTFTISFNISDIDGTAFTNAFMKLQLPNDTIYNQSATLVSGTTNQFRFSHSTTQVGVYTISRLYVNQSGTVSSTAVSQTYEVTSPGTGGGGSGSSPSYQTTTIDLDLDVKMNDDAFYHKVGDKITWTVAVSKDGEPYDEIERIYMNVLTDSGRTYLTKDLSQIDGTNEYFVDHSFEEPGFFTAKFIVFGSKGESELEFEVVENAEFFKLFSQPEGIAKTAVWIGLGVIALLFIFAVVMLLRMMIKKSK